jgi:hypothetical protein
LGNACVLKPTLNGKLAPIRLQRQRIIARGIPIAAKAYHAFGTTSVFEGHGVADEVIRAYKDAYRDDTLTMRAGLVFSPDWKTAGSAPLGSLIESWGGGLGEPASGDDSS